MSTKRKTAALKGWQVVATGGYVGLIPFAPGTFGTLVALPLIWFFSSWPTLLQWGVAAGLFALGWWASRESASTFRKADAPEIVVDEVVGFFVAMVGVPFTPYWILWGFFLFRFLDIFKPFPVGLLDRKVRGPWGVMLDDLAAGLFANLVMHLMLRASL